MDHAAQVRVGERVGDLAEEAAHLIHRLPRLPREQRAEIPAGHEPHDEVGDPFAIADVVDGDDVRMRELRRGLCLAREAEPNRRVVRQLRRQHLDRHGAIESEIARAIHDRHPTPPDLSLELVLVPHCGDGALLERVTHRLPSREPEARSRPLRHDASMPPQGRPVPARGSIKANAPGQRARAWPAVRSRAAR